MKVKASKSEDNGIAQLTDSDLEIYSAGISTGGVAEIRMAEANPKRHITASSIDKEGVEFSQKFIAENKVEDRVEVKFENVAEPLPYPERYFDFIYARLVLHYLTKNELPESLSELYRILKRSGRLYVVVRSTDCDEATTKAEDFDPETNLTTYSIRDKKTGERKIRKRYFHTEQSISDYLN